MLFIPIKHYPDVKRDPSLIKNLFGKGSFRFSDKPSTPVLGLDLEFNKKNEPSIIGLSDGFLSVSCPYLDGVEYFKEVILDNPSAIIVGHSVISSDLFVLEGRGIKLDLRNMEDTIIRMWLANMHLCKTSNKSALEEDADARRGAGFMNLWTMLSIYTSLQNYKSCREDACDGPCPKHDVFGYNGLDAMGPVLAMNPLRKQCILRGVEKLYPMHRDLAYVLAKMSQHGIQLDMPYVRTLREEFAHGKEEAAKLLPFNPNSKKQIQEFFGDRGIVLPNTQEQTVRDNIELFPNDVELSALLEYKELGNGPDRWFGAKFVDKDGRVHPRIGFFTSSARLMCVNPNFQNVAKRRIDRKTGENVGKKIRRAIIAPEGYYIVRADYQNAENRVYLYLAGYTNIPNTDFHSWMVENIGITDTHPFAMAMGGAREAAKSVTHGSDYLEGLVLVEASVLKRSAKIQNEIKLGARLVFPDWTFNKKIVTFTGINLARRAFGDASYENRRKSLDLVQRYFDKFPLIRELQKKITKQAEMEKIVRPPHGYALLSYGQDEDRMKQAAAVWGSQPVAHFTKLALLDLDAKFLAGRPMRPVLQVHDEILTYVPNNIDPLEAASWLRSSMEFETPEIKGFIIPAEASYGPNWRDQTKIKL